MCKVKHNETCTMSFGRPSQHKDCPRCEELKQGATPRAGYTSVQMQQQNQRLQAIRNHDCKKKRMRTCMHCIRLVKYTTMLTNVHLIRVSFKAATENDGDSIVLQSQRFTGNKIEISPYHPIDTNICNIAEDWLTKNGYQPIFKAEGKKCYFIACAAKDGNYFKKLKKS